MQNETIKAVNLCYTGIPLVTCAFLDGKYYFLPIPGAQEKSLKINGRFSCEFDYWIGKTERELSNKLLPPFDYFLGYAKHYNELPISNIGLKPDDTAMEILFKWAKINAGDRPTNSHLYIKQTMLKVSQAGGEITFTEVPL